MVFNWLKRVWYWFVSLFSRRKVNKDHVYMRQAIEQMRQAGIVERTGGPFGAVIVLQGKVIACCGNRRTILSNFST